MLNQLKTAVKDQLKFSSIKDDHYFYDEKTFSLIGYRTKKTYQLGQKVKIKIKNADLEKKHLDFNLINLIVFVVSNSFSKIFLNIQNYLKYTNL